MDISTDYRRLNLEDALQLFHLETGRLYQPLYELELRCELIKVLLSFKDAALSRLLGLLGRECLGSAVRVHRRRPLAQISLRIEVDLFYRPEYVCGLASLLLARHIPRLYPLQDSLLIPRDLRYEALPELHALLAVDRLYRSAFLEQEVKEIGKARVDGALWIRLHQELGAAQDLSLDNREKLGAVLDNLP